MRTYYTLLAIFIFMPVRIRAQAVNPTGSFMDQDHGLALKEGTTIISDITADGGNAIYRPSSAPDNTVWYGPYIHLQGGNYLIRFRLKVSSNASDSRLFSIDVVSVSGGKQYGYLDIFPDMFRKGNEWELVTIPVQVPDNVSDLEIRGIAFRSGISDVSLDYITVLPGDTKGIYSTEFTVTGKGNVGIGTTAPAEKLSVNGNIRAKEIKVETANWPDYVFENSYQSHPLTDLEAYIKTNKHLPEIPSAKETEENGVSLGEMNAKLLKKIEELTLYVIGLKKENEQQQTEINELKKTLK